MTFLIRSKYSYVKITNRKYITIIRVFLLFLFFIFIVFLLIVSDFVIRIIFAIADVVVFLYFLNIKYRVGEFSGECMTFRKYSLFKNGYIRPYVELPIHYIKKLRIRKFLFGYYITIVIDKGAAAPKKITLSLLWFKQSELKRFVKTIESKKKE